MALGLYLAFIYAPKERTMGEIQRIFYFHVPTAWVSFLAFFVVFIASTLYLIKRNPLWDELAVSSAELGVLFCSLVLVMGPLWAKPVWGVYWTWDARLTSFLVLWLIFVSYLLLRKYIADVTKRGKISAVVGIIGFLDIPLVYFSIRWWRTLHPQPVIAGGNDSGLDTRMLLALLVCLAAFTCLYILILQKRIKVEKMENEIDYLYKILE